MTYNDCVHFIVCDRCPNCKPSECEFFKNKADYVEVRHGKWEAKEHTSISTNRHYYTFRCSECKRWNGTHRQNYCPNCGAKMNGKDINVPTTDERSDT